MQIGLVPVIPLTFAFFLPIGARVLRGRRWFINAYAVIATLTTLIGGTWLFKEAYSSPKPLVYPFGNWPAPVGIMFEVDRTSALLVLVTVWGFFLTAIYATRFLSREKGVEFFFTAMLGLEAGTLGAFMTGDAFNLFVMLEVIGASAYFIVGFYRYRADSIEGAFKYGISGAVATSLYFLALGFIYASFGTLNMAGLSAGFHGIHFSSIPALPGGNTAVTIFFALTITMVLVKSAVFPGHYWLPDAYEGAPIPAAALLSGFVEVVGIYILARYIFTVFAHPPDPGRLSLVLLSLGTASAFLGATMMLHQRRLKRMIAYSTILHMGYLFMGLGTMSRLGLIAVTYHIVNHALAKVLLFFAAGSFIFAAGTDEIEELAGMGKRMPLTTAAFVIATLSLVGVPPLNVFFSKMLIFDALLQVSPLIASVVIITSAIAAWAYFRVMATLWRGKAGEKPEPYFRPAKEDPVMMAVMAVLVGAVVLVGILSPLILSKYVIPAATATMNYRAYIDAALQYAVNLL